VAYGTAAVVALICAGVYALKKLNHGAPLNRGRYLEVLEARPVGRNVQLILVRVAGRILLLAYGGESVTPVAELSEEELPKSSAPAGGLEGFKALFKRLTGAQG
jgi:flagellar biogenesis protein FliO